MDRRTLITAAALAPVALAAPAVAQTMLCAPVDAVDLYWKAVDDVNNDRISVEEFLAATDDLDYWEPRTPRDCLRKFLAMFDGEGFPEGERLEILKAQAKRLLMKEAA